MNGVFLHDSIFQWVGAYLGALTTDYLHSAGFYYAVIAAGFLAMIFRGLKNHNYWPLAGYLAGSVLIFTLFVQTRSTLRPSEVAVVAINQGFESKQSGILDDLPPDYRAAIDIPLGFTAVNQALDGAVIGMTARINRRFFLVPFEYLRVSVHMQSARINDPELAGLLHDFTDKCYRPALVMMHRKTAALTAQDLEKMSWPGDPNLTRLYPGLAYKPSELLAAGLSGRRAPDTCDDAWTLIATRLSDHVNRDPIHKAELARLSGGRGGQTEVFKGTPAQKEEAYIKRLLANQYTLNGQPPMNSGAQPSLFHGQHETKTGTLRQITMELLGGLGYVFGASTMMAMAANISALGPYIQGLTLMLIYALFPFAVLFALWPGNWSVLVKYFSSILWVKSWTLGWAILSMFDRHQATLTTFDQAMDGLFGWTMYPVALSAAYVSVPIICGVVITTAANSLGSLAAGGAFGGAAGSGATRMGVQGVSRAM